MNTPCEPCPWCRATYETHALDEVQPGTFAVWCGNCGAMGPHDLERQQSVAEAIDRWNGMPDANLGIGPKNPPVPRQQPEVNP